MSTAIQPTLAWSLRRHDALVLALAALSCFVGLAHPLQNLNEGLYARVALEMLHSSDWIIPTLDGVPYLEKPPLMYWLTAASFALFGVTEWSARATPVIGELLALGAVAWFARRRLGRTAALVAPAALASFPLCVAMSRTLLFDSLFTGLLAWALVLLHEALHAPRGEKWLRASAVALAGAVLTKGFAALVFYALVALVVAAFAGRARRRVLRDPVAWLLFLAVAAPWHVAASLRQPGFAWFYFVNEHVMRFLDERVPRDYHTGPWWFYLPRLLADAFPWSLALLTLPWARRRRLLAEDVLLWTWLLVPLVLFSLSRAKGEYYLLVAMPALALIVALRLEALAGERGLALLPATWVAILAAASLALPDLAPYRLPQGAAALVAAAILAACAAAVLLWQGRGIAGALALALAALPIASFFSGFLAENEEYKSARRLAQDVRALGDMPLYVYRDFERVSALAFYHPGPLGVVDSRSKDLWYGARVAGTLQRESPRGAFALVALADRADDLLCSSLSTRLRLVASRGPLHLYASVR